MQISLVISKNEVTGVDSSTVAKVISLTEGAGTGVSYIVFIKSKANCTCKN